jgi:AcrR family transcriptional regulator
MASHSEAGQVRPGGRTARTREAVCRATLQELAEHGYGNLSVEAVAERSGVHKTTIYRRWRDVDGLVVDSLNFAVDDDWQPYLSGDVRSNLLRLAEDALHAFTDPETGPTHTAVVAAAFQSSRAEAAVQGFFEDRFGRASAIVETAIAREELPPRIDRYAVIQAMMAPIYFRLFIARNPVGKEDIEQAVDVALAAARNGVFDRNSGDRS